MSWESGERDGPEQHLKEWWSRMHQTWQKAWIHISKKPHKFQEGKTESNTKTCYHQIFKHQTHRENMESSEREANYHTHESPSQASGRFLLVKMEWGDRLRNLPWGRSWHWICKGFTGLQRHGQQMKTTGKLTSSKLKTFVCKRTLSRKLKEDWRGSALMVDHPLSKCEPLSSDPRTPQKKENQNKMTIHKCDKYCANRT
jgi:hypothetical protein